jgi:hypothetical protein
MFKYLNAFVAIFFKKPLLWAKHGLTAKPYWPADPSNPAYINSLHGLLPKP